MAEDRFAPPSAAPADNLNAPIYGLVQPAKLRMQAVSADDAGSESSGAPRAASGASTPEERSLTPAPALKRKRKAARGKLSFAVNPDDEEAENENFTNPVQKRPHRSGNSWQTASRESATGLGQAEDTITASHANSSDESSVKRRLGPNAAIGQAPKIMTKSALQKENAERERLRQEFISIQEDVKATEISVPFVFFDGTNVPGGKCRVKKGDPVWLFLDKCRKLGAELSVGAANQAKSRRQWARVGVDDLLLIRNEIIIPHHYDFYYFIVNKTLGYDGRPLFDFSAEPTEASRQQQAAIKSGQYDPLMRADQISKAFENLEGSSDDPNVTKVVNRPWFERHKHIFPANTWEEFDPSKDYTTAARKDAQGNTYFYPR